MVSKSQNMHHGDAKRYLIIHPKMGKYDKAEQTSGLIALRLEGAGHTVDFKDSGDRYDLVISLGGDGMMMRTVARFSKRGIPTIGINAGDVGFLTSGEVADWVRITERILQESYDVEERIALCFEYNGRTFGPFANEVVLKHPRTVASFDVAVNDVLFYRNIAADGVLVATSTGSTAYSASAGGPLLLPLSNNVVITMLAPIRLNTRSLVLEELAVGGSVTLTIRESKKDQPVLLAADADDFGVTDGFENDGLTVGESIVVKKDPQPMLFATFGLSSYAKALREKKRLDR